MKIAVYHNLPSGGALRVLQAYLSHRPDGHQAELFLPDSANDEFVPLSPFVDHVHRLPYPQVQSKIGNITQLREIRRFAERTSEQIDGAGFDVVLASASQLTQAPEILPYVKTPTLYFAPEYNRMVYDKPFGRTAKQRLRDLAFYPRRQWIKNFDARSIRAASKVFTNSNFSQGNLRRVYGVESEVVYNGVDTDEFRPLRLRREGFVLSVGALAPIKGHGFVIDALATIPDPERPKLVIIGDRGGDASQFVEQANRLSVKVTVLKNIPFPEVVGYYNKASVVAAAQYAEPFGLIAIEAMACETPIVAVAEGGLTESIVPNQNGILVERDPQQFGAALQRLLKDRELSERLGKNGRADVLEHWQWSRTAEHIERLLNQLVAKT